MRNFKIIRTVVETSYVMANDEQAALGYFHDGEVTDTFYEDVGDCKVIVTEEIEKENNIIKKENNHA